jgi:hypothetical protein
MVLFINLCLLFPRWWAVRNQRALHPVFLLKTGLEIESFIGTGVTSAVIVDIARL